MRIPSIMCLLLYCGIAIAQVDTTAMQTTSIHLQDLNRLGKKYDHLSATIQRSSHHLLTTLQSKEQRLCHELSVKDSTAAHTLFAGSREMYEQLQAKLKGEPIDLPLHPLKDYLPGIDSLQTALFFLQAHTFSKGIPGVIQRTQNKLMLLQNQLQRANDVAAFIQQRQQQLQTQLQVYHLGDKLLGIKKQAYYYKEQVEQYKGLLHDPDPLTTRVLGYVRDLPAFQDFFLHHSYLSALFRLPGSGPETTGQPIPGLQTRDQVNAAVAERLGPGADLSKAITAGDANTNPSLGGVQDATGQMNKWKDKLTGGNSNTATADFRPNPHHNKTFFQRIQLGFDLQSQSGNRFIPALSTIGLTAGYLLNTRSIIGIGTAYKLGWGQPFNHISFSSQGVAFRSFLDWRLKGNLWIAGGYEANYLNSLEHLTQIPAISAWQHSALAGLMKTYKAGRQKGNMQLLFDALYRQHVPQSQPVVFRMGYFFH